MGRKYASSHLQSIYTAVEKNPGAKPGWIARLLGLHRSEVTRALPAMEARGYLLSEDARGGLWPFRKKRD